MKLLQVYNKVKYNHYRIPYNLTDNGTRRAVWSGKSMNALHCSKFSLGFEDRQVRNGQWKRISNEVTSDI